MSYEPLIERRILVVEDEFFLAEELSRELEAAGAVVIGPAACIQGALALIEGEAPIDAALLDVNLGGEMVFPVAEALVVRSVPFVFTSGYDDHFLAEHYALMPRCQKPTDITSILDQLTMLLPATSDPDLVD